MANGTSGAIPFAGPSTRQCARLAESSNIPKATYAHSLNIPGMKGMRIINAPTILQMSNSRLK